MADSADNRIRALLPLPSQTITFAAIPDQPLDAGPVALLAAASSGLPVTFASHTVFVCNVSGSAVTLVSVGTCTIQANQGGDSDWSPASAVIQSFQVTAPDGLPGVVSMTPTLATGLSNTFALTYSDTGGNAALSRVGAIFNSATTAANSCYVLYYPATKLLYLLSDSGLGSSKITPGSGTPSNSQCTIGGSGTSVVKSGNNLVLNLEVTATATYTGKQSVFMYAADLSTTNTGWIKKGAWTPSPNQKPEAVSASPNSAQGLTNTFVLTYADPNGALDLNFVEAIFSSAVNTTNSCVIYYYPADNSLYLLNDAGTVRSKLTLGSGSISNDQCSVARSGTSVQRAGDTLTMNLALTASGDTGKQNLYMYAMDHSGATSGWVSQGTWAPAPNLAPYISSASPRSATGATSSFALTYSDPNGTADLSKVEVDFGSSVKLAHSCFVTYSPASNLVSLLNDSGVGSTKLTPGTGVISNAQCTIAGNAISIVRSGGDLTLNLSVTASPSYAGNYGIFMSATDNSSATSGWVKAGTWAP